MKKPPYIIKYLQDRQLNPDDFGWGNAYGYNWISLRVNDKDGNKLFYKLRKDPTDENNKIKYKFYPKGSNSTLFGLDVLPQYEDYIFICEGEYDCMLLRSKNINAITSTSGSGTFKDEWIEYFKHIKDIYICFDNDEAGNKGAINLMLKLIEYDFNIFIITLPPMVDGKDISDYFIDNDGSRDELFAMAEKINSSNLILPTLIEYEDIKQMRGEIQRLTEIQDGYKKNKHNVHPAIHTYLMNNINKLMRKARLIIYGMNTNNTYTDIETLKAVPILNILDSYNIKYESAGHNLFKFKLRNEKTASATAYIDKNSFYDYGDSGVGGSVIDLVMHIEKCELKESLAILNKHL